MNLYDFLIIDWLLIEKYYFFLLIKKYFNITYNILYINNDFEWININLIYSANTKNLSISIAYLEEWIEETDIKTTDISLHDQMWISVYRV